MMNRGLCILYLLVFSSISMRAKDFTEKEISFKNDDVVLKGTLIIPVRKKSDMPAIVFLHGSGPHVRSGFRYYAEVFAKLGFASIRFDKRGSGKSSGSWVKSSLDDLAKDVLAAVSYLKMKWALRKR